MFEELKTLQQRTEQLKIHLEDENPNMVKSVKEMKVLEKEFRNIPKTDIMELTKEEIYDRGVLISTIVFDQMKIDYLCQIHTGTAKQSFNDFFEQRLNEFFEYSTTALEG